jgi:deoxyribodipyrimidine photolyase
MGLVGDDAIGDAGISVFKLGQYPEPIVEHKFARERALHRYKKGLGKL